MAPEIQHRGLNATFKGIERKDQIETVHQFLGIKYASIPARFEKAKPVNGFEGDVVDVTKYGYDRLH
jgi:carboxylesterase type B